MLGPEEARETHRELVHGIQYERVELGGITRQWRAVRPVGDVYFGSMIRAADWVTPPVVAEVLAGFEDPGFISWLSALAGEELAFLRPVTAYRMGQGDRLCLHDDMSDPDHAVSVAYNLTPEWGAGWGGETRFGRVVDVTPLPTPADSPIDLQEWHIRDEQRFPPQYNSMLVMRLDFQYAHGVAEVLVPQQRHALVGIYGRAWS